MYIISYKYAFKNNIKVNGIGEILNNRTKYKICMNMYAARKISDGNKTDRVQVTHNCIQV